MKEKEAEYVGSCIGNSENFVHAVMDKAIDITYKTFIKHVDWKELREEFPIYDWGIPGGLQIWEDFAVSFKRSMWRGWWVYIVRHSGIEYFWRVPRC